MSNANNVVLNTKNTVFVREHAGLNPFQWGGACMRVDPIARDRGAMNPTHRQAQQGGTEIDGHTNGLSGLVTSALVMKEKQRDALQEELVNCYWDVDRRTHCDNLPGWYSWTKIKRLAIGRAVSDEDMGSTFNEDEAENMTTLTWNAEAKCTIHRVTATEYAFGTPQGS